MRVTSPTLKRSRVCFSVWFENAGIAALNLDDGGVAQIVHVDRGCREQNRLLENPQGFARARDLALRRAGFVGGLIAVVKRLRDREAGGGGGSVAVNFGLDEIAGSAALGGKLIGILVADAAGESDLRAIARQRLRHVFIGGTDRGALGVELRIVLVGAHQRGLDRVGKGRRRAHTRHQQYRNRSSGNELHATHSR